MGASIPLPIACEAIALPFELIPQKCVRVASPDDLTTEEGFVFDGLVRKLRQKRKARSRLTNQAVE